MGNAILIDKIGGPEVMRWQSEVQRAHQDLENRQTRGASILLP